MGSKCIEIASQAIRFDGDIASGAALSPFENCVFDEMTDAIECGSFMA
jgi:hypothetical protein